MGETLGGLSQHSYLRIKLDLVHFFHRGQHRRRYMMFLGLILDVVVVSRFLDNRITPNDNLFLSVEIGVDVSIPTLM